jgi:tetratricopeptide (TPR) repeat protein
MFKRVPYIFIVLFFTFLGLNFQLSGESLPLHAFRDYGNSSIQKMEILGEVTSKSHMISKNRPRLLNYDTREMILSAKLIEHQGVRIGDTIYIIQKDPDHRKYLNGLIVGKATIFSVFQTGFQGWMIKARGNLSMVKKGHFIARLDFGSERNTALEYLKMGDKYNVLGDFAKAYFWYKKSLDIDSQRPETFLKLTQLTFSQGMRDQAYTYIQEAWQRSDKIEDPNDMLELPGLYINVKMDRIKDTKSQEKRFKELLALLKEVRHYKEQMNWIGGYIQDDYKSMLEKAGIPEYGYQYGLANLFNEIYHVMNRNHINQVLGWITKDEREVLYEPLFLAYAADPFEYPQKSWDNAFFEAALYHYKMATELNELDTRSSYEIIMLSYEKLKTHPSMVDADRFKNLIKHYGRFYLRVPDETDHYSRVQNVLNTFNQF